MVIYADRIKLMFIHAPKTGGSSVARALAPWISNPHKWVPNPKSPTARSWHGSLHAINMHADYEDERERIDRLLGEGWTLTSTVRNPFTLMQSVHHRWGKDMEMMEFMEAATADPDVAYISGIYFRKEGGDPFSQIMGPADPVLRFESLDADFASLCQRVGFEAEFSRDTRDGVVSYDPMPHSKESIELVKRHFGKDLERWGYTR